MTRARLDPWRASRLDLLVPSGLAVVVAGLAFLILGLVDDLMEDAGSRGFRGHLRALLGGRLTGGGIKLLGGALAAVAVASLALPEGRHALLLPVGAVAVASAANVANLLDPPGGAWSAGLAGAAVAGLPFDLREKGMLGDAGANSLGAVAGTLLLAGPVWLLVGAVVVLLALQLLSERVSFSRVIDGNRVLRAADRFGRPDR